MHTVRKKTSRLSTRITASLGLISLTRDEEFERHYENFKSIEKTIRVFAKNLSTFVEHFEKFLLSLQYTSENLSDLYRDKGNSYRKELEELRRKNKALICEHFHAFKRTIERQVVAVCNQLLQKFSGPQQLIGKRSTKLLDYDTKSKEYESCSDPRKKETLRDQYVIAKDLYDRVNDQLKLELPLFNRFALDIFRNCVMVLLECRRTLILSYTKQTASLLETPLMMTFTASDVASSIFMSCETKLARGGPHSAGGHAATSEFNTSGGSDSSGWGKSNEQIIHEILEKERKDSGETSGHDTKPSSGNDDYISSRPQSAASHLSSDFDQMAIAAREISSTPLSHVSGSQTEGVADRYDEPDGDNDGPIDARQQTSTPIADQQDCKDDEANETGITKSKAPKGLKQENTSRQQDLAGESVASTGARIHAIDNSINSTKEKRKKKKFQIYIAEWPFVAIGPNQLTIECNQPLKLIKGCDECGNTDWSLVQNKRGQSGYVPTSYIKKKD